VQILWWWWQWT